MRQDLILKQVLHLVVQVYKSPPHHKGDFCLSIRTLSILPLKHEQLIPRTHLFTGPSYQQGRAELAKNQDALVNNLFTI